MAHTDVFSKVSIGYEGYLNVGSTLNSRKKLYARIENDALVFYKSPPLKAPKGNIFLADVKKLTGALPAGFPPPPATLNPTAWFALEGGNRTYVFNAGSSSGRDQWIGVLKDLIALDAVQGEEELVCGELTKCDGKGKSWKNRCFVVSTKSRSMMYFDKPMEATSRVHLSAAPGEEATTITPLSVNSAVIDFSFFVSSGGRMTILTASDSRDYAAWVQSLSQAIAAPKKPPLAPRAAPVDLKLGSGSVFEMVNTARESVVLREGVMKKKTKMKMWAPCYFVLQHVVERGYQDVLLSDANSKQEYVRGIKHSTSCRSLRSAAFHTSKSGKATKGGCRIDVTFEDVMLPLRCADFNEAKEWVDQFNLVRDICEGMGQAAAAPPSQELPPSHPLYMRAEKKERDEEGDDMQENDEIVKGVLERKRFNQWKPFLCTVNKQEEILRLVFSAVPASGGSASKSQVMSKNDVLLCDTIADVELCTSGKGASEGRRFDLRLKSGQVISLRAKSFETCSRWVAALENLKVSEFAKDDTLAFAPLPHTTKIDLGPPVSSVSENLFTFSLVLTGQEASRVNPLITAWVYEKEATLKDVTLTYPFVELYADDTGACTAIPGMNKVDADDSLVVFTSNPLKNGAKSRYEVSTPHKQTPPTTESEAEEPEEEPPEEPSEDSLDEPLPPPPGSRHVSISHRMHSRPPSRPPSRPSSPPPSRPPSRPSSPPPSRPASPPSRPASPPSRPASPPSRPLSCPSSPPPRPASPSRAPPPPPSQPSASSPAVEVDEEMGELVISPQLQLMEAKRLRARESKEASKEHSKDPSRNTSFVSQSNTAIDPATLPSLTVTTSATSSAFHTPHSVHRSLKRISALGRTSVSQLFHRNRSSDSMAYSEHSQQQLSDNEPEKSSEKASEKLLENNNNASEKPIETNASEKPSEINSSEKPSESNLSENPSESTLSEKPSLSPCEKSVSPVAERPSEKELDTPLTLSGGFRRIVGHLTRGSLKPGPESDQEDLADDEALPTEAPPSPPRKPAWLQLGATEPRDCPPPPTREEKEREGEAPGSPRNLGGSAGTVVHTFRVLVPLYTANRPNSELVAKHHPEQVVVNTASSPSVLLRFSLFHVSKRDDPDSVNLREAEELALCVLPLHALSTRPVAMDLKMLRPQLQAALHVQRLPSSTVEVSSCFGAIARKSFMFPSTIRMPLSLQPPPPPPTLARSVSSASFESASEADDEFVCVVHEKLTQSPFTFSVPALVLRFAVAAKASLVKRLTEHIAVAKTQLAEMKTIPDGMMAIVKAGVVVHPFVSHSKLVSNMEGYLKSLETSLREQEQLLHMYQDPTSYLAQHSGCVTNAALLGVPFRASVARKVSALRYIPINLHIHAFNVQHHRKGEEDVASALYEEVSVGASVDHVTGFKKGDVHTLNNTVQDLTHELATLDQSIEKATNKELQDLEDKRCIVELKLQQADTDLLGRKECLFAQSLAVLISSFVTKLQCCVFGSSLRHSPAVLTRIAAIGFLFQVESLLSTIYDEAHMLADYEYSVKQLQRVQFRLARRDDSESPEAPPEQEASDVPSFQLASQIRVHLQPSKEDESLFPPMKIHFPTIRKSGYTSRNMQWKPAEPTVRPKKRVEPPPPKLVVVLELPHELYARLPSSLTGALPDGTEARLSHRLAPKLINVVCVFFNQGVNETQSLAISLGKVEQQREINAAAKLSLETYANNFIAYCQRNSEGHTEALMRAIKEGLEQLNHLLQGKQHKDIQLLKVCKQLSRLMCAGGVVSCKSAKDRTSMFITWETALALQESHGVRGSHTQAVMDLTRTHGVRRKNVLKNTRKKAYAFNAIQRRALPSALSPPDTCCGKTQS